MNADKINDFIKEVQELNVKISALEKPLLEPGTQTREEVAKIKFSAIHAQLELKWLVDLIDKKIRSKSQD